MTKITVQISRQRGITINVKIVLKKIHQLYSSFIPSCTIINLNDQMSKTEKKRKKKTRSSEKEKKTNFTHNLIEQKQSLQIVHKIQVTKRGKSNKFNHIKSKDCCKITKKIKARDKPGKILAKHMIKN